MADEQHRWLDRETAERLLNGEPPEAADPAIRDQAERLAGTLRALSAPPPSADGELPGEAAALAAFRKQREEREGRSGPDTATGAADSDVGLVRLGSRRGEGSGTPDGRRSPRPLRLGLAATLVAGMVGGAAVLAGAGVLPTPSGDAGADPAVSASAPPPERRTLSTPPDAGRATPEGTAGRGEDGPGARPDADTGRGGRPTPRRTGPDSGDAAARPGRGGTQTASSCRAWRDGEKLNDERRRLLEEAAGGPARVGPYCRAALSADGGSGTSARGDTGDTPEGNGKGNEKKDKGRGNGNNGNGNNGNGNNGNNGNGGNSNGSGNNGNSGKKGDSGNQGQGDGHGQGNGKAQGNTQ
ncbi:hypothetical protein [Streptomyces griseoflavus]|uniref:hypothetical protein n=1 Tax=Streptomyces griseoflavus TaxID=35619 RepID=UPI003D765D7F